MNFQNQLDLWLMFYPRLWSVPKMGPCVLRHPDCDLAVTEP